ncbi:MAG: HlyD family secretion protein [Porticoccaceae bacterium]
MTLLVLIAAGLGAIALYSHYETLYPSTDNAYVDAIAVRISSQVEGPVTKVLVLSQEAVTKGDLLLGIDPTPFEAEAESAETELALARRQVAENRAELASVEADVEDAKVHLANAHEQLRRLKTLKEQAYSSAQQTEDAQATYDRALATLKVRQAQHQKALARLTNGAASEDPLVVAARARLKEARWALAHSQLHAPCDGTLEAVNVHAGETVRAHQAVMVLVCTDRFWILANYKETQLARIRPGQHAKIEVDMYPGQEFTGVVESISPASGTAFSLLPPENATGNWVKTTQRVPVKILVTGNSTGLPLRVGASSAVSIDTRRAAES